MRSFKNSLLSGIALAAAFSASADADTLNVLWYDPGTFFSESDLTADLSTPGTGDPSTTDFNITYWSSGAMPAGTYNVLVVGSIVSTATLSTYVTASSLDNRVLVTGQDADYHVTIHPGPANFDGPRGFLRDAINWAGAGTGMGMVYLTPSDNSTLAAMGFTGLGTYANIGDNSVTIPPEFATYPINTNLTSAGLSNWSTSAHAAWTGLDSALWTSINLDSLGDTVTFVTASTAGAGGSGIPTPINDTTPAMESDNLGTTLEPDFEGGTLIIVPSAANLSNNFTVGNVAGNTINANGNTTSFSGTFAGAGGLTIADSTGGGHPISFNNAGGATYTGITHVASAMLQAGADDVFAPASAVVLDNTSTARLDLNGHNETIGGLSGGGNAGGNIALGGGTLTINGGGSFGGAITGTGGLTIGGVQPMIFNNSGGATYTGITHITSAVLQAGADDVFAPASAVVLDNASTAQLDLNGHNETIGGLSGGGNAGGNVALGGGTLTINGGGSFGGAITGTGGLTIGGVQPMIFDKSGGATYTGITHVASAVLQAGADDAFSPASAVVLDNSNTARLDLNAHNETIGGLSGGGNAGGNVALGGGTLIINGSGDFAGAFTGGGNLVFATGTQVLTGVSSFGGATIINGTLVVGDAFHPGAALNSDGGVTIGNAGVLQGHGTVQGAVLNTGSGTVSPGASIGTLMVGSFAQGPAATLSIEVSPAQASLLIVTGAASLDGTLAVQFDPGTYTAAVYPILTGNPVTGRFASFAQTGDPSGLALGVAYSATEVDLVLTPTAPAAVFGNIANAGIDDARVLSSLVLNRAGRRTLGGCGNPLAERSSATSSCGSGFKLWLRPFGTLSRTYGAGSLAGYRTTASGTLGGVDDALGNGGFIGAFAGYSNDDVHESGSASKANIESYQFGAYGEMPAGAFLLNATAFYLSDKATIKRDTTAGGIATSSPNATGFAAALEVSYNGFSEIWSPLLQLHYAQLKRDSLTETGAGLLGLTVDGDTSHSLHADIGTRVHRSYHAGRVTLTPSVLLALEQRLSDSDGASTARLTAAPGASFIAGAVEPARTAVIVNASLSGDMGNNTELFGEVDGRFSANQQQGGVTLRAGIRF